MSALIRALAMGIAFFAGFSFSSSRAFAGDSLSESAFTLVPSRFNSKELALGARGLGEICYSRGVMPDGSVCNPAFMDEVPSGFLMGRAYVGNGYSALTTANQLLFQPVTSEFLKGLFQSNNVTSLEASVGLVFGAKNLSASFSPYRVQYLSEIHNPNVPVIAIHAAVESVLSFQGGMELGGFSEKLKDVSVGAKLRLLKRNYVHGSFSLLQAIGQNPRELVPVKEQYAAYLDPSVGWRPTLGKWRFKASAALLNLGAADHRDTLYPDLPDAALGLGVEPPVGFGSLRLGLDAVNLVHADGLTSMLRLGLSYQLGIVELMGGWNSDAVTGGVLFGFQIIQAGVVYEFARSELDGGFSDKRISTEISVKL